MRTLAAAASLDARNRAEYVNAFSAAYYKAAGKTKFLPPYPNQTVAHNGNTFAEQGAIDGEKAGKAQKKRGM